MDRVESRLVLVGMALGARGVSFQDVVAPGLGRHLWVGEGGVARMAVHAGKALLAVDRLLEHFGLDGDVERLPRGQRDRLSRLGTNEAFSFAGLEGDSAAARRAA
jgi:hypothetical protein